MSKLKLAIVGLVLLVVATYAILAILLVNSSARRVPDKPGFTAQEALPSAQEAARAWQEDAQLMSANASWRGLPPDELLEAEVSWAFAFFSPGARSLRVFQVTPEGAEEAETMDANPNAKVVDAGSWQVDSGDVLSTFLQQGGRDFLHENPEATVSLRLGSTEDGDSSVWLAMGISSADKKTIVVQVDPVTGAVKTPAP
jgi:hypothetical protein